MDNKKKDDDIIELTEEELDEILSAEDFEGDDGCEEVHSFVFSNPDPYARLSLVPMMPQSVNLLSMKKATSL